MRKSFLLSLFLCISLLGHVSVACAQKTKTAPSDEAVFSSLDEAVGKQKEYLAAKESRIAELQKQIEESDDDKAKYDLTFSLYSEYSTYNSKKAMAALEECLSLATSMKKKDFERRTNIFIAYQLTLDGKYEDAIKLLDQIDSKKLSQKSGENFFFVKNYALEKMASQTKDKANADKLRRVAAQGATQFLRTANKTTQFYYQQKVISLLSSEKTEEAIAVCNEWEKNAKAGTVDYALMARYMAVCNKKNSDKQLPWLITAAENEITSAMMNGDALQALSALLAKRGDAKRSKTYADLAKNLRAKYTSKEEVVEEPATEEVTQEQLTETPKAPEKQEQTSDITIDWRYTGAMAGIVVLFLIVFIISIRQRKKINFAENKLIEVTNRMAAMRMEMSEGYTTSAKKVTGTTQATAVNSQEMNKTKELLEEANKQIAVLSEKIKELSEQNAELTRKNKEFAEKKEELAEEKTAIAEEKMEAETSETKDNNQEEILKEQIKVLSAELDCVKHTKDLLVPMMVGQCSKMLTEEQMEDVYERFDAIILKMFPHFARDFNALLQEEYRQIPRSRRELTTEMRMAALIRVGITNSAQIAEFLHLSANTVYNYRARLKSKAIGDRKDFEERIMEIV